MLGASPRNAAGGGRAARTPRDVPPRAALPVRQVRVRASLRGCAAIRLERRNLARRPYGDTLLARRLLLLALALASCKAEPPAAARSANPQRIVTLTPSSSELVIAVGGAARLVAVDRFSQALPGLAALPAVGDFLSPNLEAILALDPDMVVLDDVQTRTADALAAAHVATLILPMHTIADVEHGLAAIGERLGRTDLARTRIAAIEAAIDHARAGAAARPHRRILLVVDRELGSTRGIVAAGPGSFLDELAAVLGAENAMAGAGTRYPKLSSERVVAAAPDVILDATFADDPVAAVHDWSALPIPAVEHDRVRMLREPYYTSPGPRVGEALAGLERLLE